MHYDNLSALLEKMKNDPKASSKKVIIYDNNGELFDKISYKIKQLQLDNVFIANGGIENWQSEGLPVE